jgi:hypothetical protein
MGFGAEKGAGAVVWPHRERGDRALQTGACSS